MTLRIRFLLIGALALVYAATAWLGLELAIAPGYATAVFPASGVALAFVLIFGIEVLPGVFLGSAAHNYLRLFLQHGATHEAQGLLVCLGIATVATLQTYIAYRLLAPRIKFPNDLADDRDLGLLVLLGGPVASLTAATLAQVILLVSGTVTLTALPLSWFIWWVGDMMGVVVFTPILLLWLQRIETRERGRVLAVSLPVFVTFGVTVAAYIYTSAVEHERLLALGQAEGTQMLLAWSLLALGMVLCGLLGAFLLGVTGRHALVRREIAGATERLQDANDRLEVALRIQTRFLATMSHEIRTPLNAIVGYADLLSHAELPERAATMAHKILHSSRDLSRLVNDILNASKTDAHAYEVIARPFSLTALVRSVDETVRPEAQRKGLQFKCDTGGSADLWLLGDELRIRQILLNLLGNAIKYTDRGFVSLQLQAVQVRDQVELVFLVQDSGRGIAAGDVPRLFVPFLQLDLHAATLQDEPRQGVGLGLSISKNLALCMGGDIHVTTELGYGSAFRFRVVLPSTQPQVVPDVVPKAGPRTAQRILVAEDDLMIQELVSVILHDAGHGVDIVGDGLSAIAAAERHTYDVILMDMRMPQMSGIEATRKLRTLPGLENTRIVAMTANAFSEDRAACLAAGMQDFLAKPFTADELLRILDRSSN